MFRLWKGIATVMVLMVLGGCGCLDVPYIPCL
jgi:hypothetical protein